MNSGLYHGEMVYAVGHWIQVKDFELMGVTSAEEFAAFLKTYEEVY